MLRRAIALASLMSFTLVLLDAQPAAATLCGGGGYEAVDPVYSVEPATPCLFMQTMPGSCGGNPTLELRNDCATPVTLPDDFLCQKLGAGYVACGELAPGITATASPEPVDGGDRVEASYKAQLEGRPITIRASYGLRYEQGSNFDPNEDYGPCAVRAPGASTPWGPIVAAAALAAAVVARRRRR